MSVIDTARGAVVATIPVAAGPHGMAVSGDGRIVWFTGDGSSSMRVIDTASDSVAQTIEVGTSPHGVALAPDGKTLLVGVYGADKVAFVDTASLPSSPASPSPSRTRSRSVPTARSPTSPRSSRGKFSLVVIDLATRDGGANDRARQAAARSRIQPRRQVPLRHRRRRQRLARDRCRQRSGSCQIATGASPHLGKWFAGAPVGTIVVQGPGELLTFDPATHAPRAPSPSASSRTGWRRTAGPSGSPTKDRTTSARSTSRAARRDDRGRQRAAQDRRPAGVAAKAAAAGGGLSIANFAFAPTRSRRAGERA